MSSCLSTVLSSLPELSAPTDTLYAGSAAQRAAIQGIVGHAYSEHAKDLPGASPRDFGAAAMRDLNTADHVYEFNQPDGPGLLFTNSESGMVGWINTAAPEKSTYFAPDDGIDEYFAHVESVKDLAREISPQEISEINAGISPDAAQSFHAGPQFAGPERSRDESEMTPEPEVEVGGAEVVAQSTPSDIEVAGEVANPEPGGPGGGPER